MKTILATALAAFLGATPVIAAEYVSFLDYPQPTDSKEFYTAIEIPAGSFTKYEIDADTGHIVVDRFLSMPMAYPTNYGSIIRVRAIGVLKMIDGGEKDSKIIAVPAAKIDPTYKAIKEVSDLPEIEQQRLQAFFRVYKGLPEGSKKVELDGFDTAAAAENEVAAAIKTYADKKK